MRSLYLIVLIALGILGPSASDVRGAEFKLTNGDILRGTAAAMDDDGLVVRLEIGGFSPRVGWGKLTQESLKDLVKNPQAARFVDPFIELPPIPPEKVVKKREIVVKPVPRLERLEKTSFLASLGSPAGLVLLGLLYLANLFAAYEIAVFRNRSTALVCGLSAFLPVVGPLVFVSLPAGERFDEEDVAMAPGAAREGDAVGPISVGKKTGPTPVPSSLSVAATENKGGSTPMAEAGMVFKRGDTTFNRRFFETKFPNFFRIVPSETEKDLVLMIRAARNEYAAKRITRISSNEMHIQLLRGSEAMIPFGDVIEVQIKHKDDKA